MRSKLNTFDHVWELGVGLGGGASSQGPVHGRPIPVDRMTDKRDETENIIFATPLAW